MIGEVGGDPVPTDDTSVTKPYPKYLRTAGRSDEEVAYDMTSLRP